MELRGLIVYRRYAEMIVRGLKRRELRSYRTKIRGPIGILSESYLMGIVELEDVIGPYNAADLIDFYEYHRVPSDVLLNMFKNKRVRIRKVSPILRLEVPIKVNIKRGARIRARVQVPDELNDLVIRRSNGINRKGR